MTRILSFFDVDTRVQIMAEIFRYKGVNGGEKEPQKPLSTWKTAVLTALNRKNSGVNGVEPEK